ncbi:MAG: aquaporin Z [Cellvibrionaceae bacterium]|jgi:aquaporin Z
MVIERFKVEKENPQSLMDTKKLLTECLGTFTLIFIGVGASAITGNLIAIGFAYGFTVLALIYAFGDISGMHINPAVTIGLAVGGKIDGPTAGGYIIAQLLGGVLGAITLAAVIGFPEQAGDLGNTILANNPDTFVISQFQGFIVEMILTFLLVSTIYHTSFSGKPETMAPLAIGAMLTALIFVGLPLTGASLNPARTLGPAIVSATVYPWGQLWIYILGPIAGGVLASVVHKALRD